MLSSQDISGNLGDEKTYEENLTTLQRVVERLESDTLGLEESVLLFEQGMVLARLCEEQLSAAEKRVQVLVSQGQALTPRHDLPLEPVLLEDPKENPDD